MQISERVKQIETITKDILDLKARYDDVLQPIRDLTENVRNLTNQTKTIADDVDTVNKIVTENSKQITQLTTNLATMGGMVSGLHERTRGLEDSDRV